MISARRLCRNGRRRCWAPAGRRHAGRSRVCRPARSSRFCLCSTVQVSNISRASITASPSRCCAATFPACRATSTSSPCRKASSCRWCSSCTVTWGPRPGSTTSIPPPLRQSSHCPAFAGLAQRGKMGWFFGFKLHLVFNNDNEIVALKLTPSNDTTPVPALTRELTGKLFGDKGYIGQKLAEDLLRRGLTLFTRVRKNMKSLPLSLQDKALLNARNMAETIIGHIKEFSSLNLSKHRSVINAFVHIIAAITAYQINPIKPKRNLQPRYQLETTA